MACSKPGGAADFLGALDEKERATGSPFGLTTPGLEGLLRDIGKQFGVVMHVDERSADIVPTVSSIDLKTYPGSMAAIAKILTTWAHPGHSGRWI